MLEKFVPSLYVESIHQIDLKMLQERGIKGIITDLDNTLVAWSEKLATPEVVQWLDDVRDNFGIQVTIVSNNKEARVSEFAKPLNVKHIAKARKPKGNAYEVACKWMNLRPEETAMIGDQLFTDILGGNRKGMFTILVMPIHEREWAGTKLLRMMERVLISLLRARGLIQW